MFSFGTLELAQAVGDFAALDAAGRRGLHAHLAAPNAAGVRELCDTCCWRGATVRLKPDTTGSTRVVIRCWSFLQVGSVRL